MDYSDVPNITLDLSLFRIQRLAASAKRMKLDFSNSGANQDVRFCKFNLSSLFLCLYLTYLAHEGPLTGTIASVYTHDSTGTNTLPAEVELSLHGLAAAPAIEPSSTGLQSHIFDLEQDLRNAEFRLQYFYAQRTSLLNNLSAAKVQAERLKK